ncbi:MAG: hypothetical protein JNG84_08480 [Archangium sp.]|nr:hypothetical protein [Archangium sp.]
MLHALQSSCAGTRWSLHRESWRACRGRGIVSLTGSWGDRQPELQRLFAPPHSPMRALWLVSTAEAAKRPACAAVTKHLVALFAEARGRARWSSNRALLRRLNHLG